MEIRQWSVHEVIEITARRAQRQKGRIEIQPSIIGVRMEEEMQEY